MYVCTYYVHRMLKLTCVHTYTYMYVCTSTGVLGLTFKSSIKYFTICSSPSRTAICISCLPSYVYTYIHTQSRTRSYVRMYMHTYTSQNHTYICTYIYLTANTKYTYCTVKAIRICVRTYVRIYLCQDHSLHVQILIILYFVQVIFIATYVYTYVHM